MKRTLFALTAAAVMGCDAPTGSMPEVGQLNLRMSLTEQIEDWGDFTHECTGEVVRYDEILARFGTQTLVDASGAHHVHTFIHKHGVGIGLTTGTRYIVNYELRRTFKFSGPTPINETDEYIGYSRIVSTGGGDNLQLRLTITVSYDAAGNATVTQTSVPVCRG